MDLIIERLTRVLKLDSAVFKEIAEDESATATSVGIAAIAAGISGITSDTNLVAGVIGGAVFGAIGLFVWTGLVYITGRLFGGKAPYIKLVRPIGYAAAPFAIGRSALSIAAADKNQSTIKIGLLLQEAGKRGLSGIIITLIILWSRKMKKSKEKPADLKQDQTPST